MNYLRGIPNFIQALREAVHRAEIVTNNKDSMLEVVVGVEKKRIEAYNKPQPAYMTKIDFDENRIWDALYRKIPSDSEYLYELL